MFIAVWVYVYHIQRALQKLEEALVSPEMKFHPVVSCPLGAGKQTWVVCKKNKYS